MEVASSHRLSQLTWNFDKNIQFPFGLKHLLLNSDWSIEYIYKSLHSHNIDDIRKYMTDLFSKLYDIIRIISSSLSLLKNIIHIIIILLEWKNPECYIDVGRNK